MARLLPPPPIKEDLPTPFRDWLNKLYTFLGDTTNLILWNQINTAGSELDDITTRPHSQLQAVSGSSEQVHVSATERTNLQELADGTDTLLHYHLRHDVTGILTGGVLSAPAAGTVFSITDGTGQIVDNFTNPLSPTITSVSWSGKTNITDTLLSGPATYILIDSSGAVSQQASAPTDDELRDKILIGVIAHSNSLIIASAPLMIAAYNNGNLAQDILSALGTITTGCTYSGNAALTMARSAGAIFRRGAHYLVDKKTPNAIDLVAQNPVQFASYCRNGSDTVFSNSTVGTTLTANRYDDGTAATAGIPNGVVLNNRWQALRLFLSTNGFTLLQYGQTTYTSLNAAVEGVSGETWFQAPITRLTAFRGYLFVRGGASDLSVMSDAFFQSAGKLGDVGTIGGASVFEHNGLSGLQGGTTGEYYHLTATQHTNNALKTDKLSAFAATTSAELAGVISDETGSGSLVLGTAPTLDLPKVVSYTVAALPAAATLGRVACVTDALAPTFLTTVVGGGAVATPVFDNGTNWVAF